MKEAELDAQRPRMLPRLVLERVDDAGDRPVYGVRDPEGRVELQLDEVSYQLARRLDGEHSLDEVCAALAAEGVPSTRAGVERCLRELGAAGLLVGTVPAHETRLLPEDARGLVERGEHHLAHGLLGEAHRYADAAHALAPWHARVRTLKTAVEAETERSMGQTGEDLARALGAVPEDEGGPAPAAQSADGAWSEPTPAEVRRVRGRALLRRALVVVAAIAVAALIPYPITVKVEFRLEPPPRSQVVVRASIGGIISDVRHDEGDSVAAGEVLVAIDDRELTAELAENAARQAELRAELARLRRGATPAQRRRETQRSQLRRVELDTKRDACERLRRAAADRLVPREQLAVCLAEVAERAAAYEQSTAEQAAALEATRPEVLSQQEARLAALDARRALLEHRLAERLVRSPIAGVILGALEPRRGSRVVPGDEIVLLARSDSGLQAVLTLPEQDLHGVVPGVEVQLRPRASPELLLKGRIDRVAPQLDLSADPRLPSTRRAYAHVSGTALRPGMTGLASVHVGRSSLLGVAFAGVGRWLRLQTFSW